MIPFLFSKLIKNVYVPQAAVCSGFQRDPSFLEGGAEEHRGAEGRQEAASLHFYSPSAEGSLAMLPAAARGVGPSVDTDLG